MAYKKLYISGLILAVFSLSFSAGDNDSGLEEKDQVALELGRQVLAVAEALKDPATKESLPVVRDLGTDSRYYVMVRGWIRQHIEMAESYRDTSVYRTSEARRKEIEARITALQKMIRAIDLE